jgi:hypothetical protein
MDYFKKLDARSLFNELTAVGPLVFMALPPFIPGLHCPPFRASQSICS